VKAQKDANAFIERETTTYMVFVEAFSHSLAEAAAGASFAKLPVAAAKAHYQSWMRQVVLVRTRDHVLKQQHESQHKQQEQQRSVEAQREILAGARTGANIATIASRAGAMAGGAKAQQVLTAAAAARNSQQALPSQLLQSTMAPRSHTTATSRSLSHPAQQYELAPQFFANQLSSHEHTPSATENRKRKAADPSALLSEDTHEHVANHAASAAASSSYPVSKKAGGGGR
jgi:hypothetical protein